MEGEVHFKISGQEATGTPSRARRYTAFILDKLEFVGVSIIVFVISYAVLNYQAIYAQMEYRFQEWRGVANPLEDVANISTDADGNSGSASLLNTVVVGSAKELSVPSLALEVHPPDVRMVIPRIRKNVPVVGVGNENLIARDWDGLEKDIQESLKDGVIHYPGTALPGEGGNVVLTGHSSYYAWDAGRFKDVFALLHEVEVADRVVMYFDQRKYVYEVFDKRVVLPSQIDVLGQTRDDRLTLITCTPIGTNLKRLVLTAKLISVQ
ncbi:MAG: sortase [Patescibacteria group bacterium]